MEHTAAEVSAAIATALQSTRAGHHHEELDHAPTTSAISEKPTFIQMPSGAYPISTSAGAPSSSHDLDLALAMPTRCSTECSGEDTTGETPASSMSANPLTLQRLGDTAPPTATVFGCVDAEEVIAPQLSDTILLHFPESQSFFVPESGAPATADIIQVTTLLLPTKDVFPTIIRPIAVSIVQFMLYHVRPLPWSSFLDCHHVGDELLIMLCSLLTCFPGDDCQKYPWPPPQMIFFMGSCFELISVEKPLSCSQCVHLHLLLCRVSGRAELSSILFLFTEGAQVDDKSVGYYLPGGSGTIQRKIALTLRLVLQIYNLALVEYLYKLSELSYCCDPWTSWQIKLLIPGTRIASSLYAFFKCMKAQTVCIEPDELDMRLELSTQTDICASNYCSIVLHTLGTCSSLQVTDCPWFLACIQPGTPSFLGTDSFWFQLSVEGYIEIHHGLLWFTMSFDVMTYLSAIADSQKKKHRIEGCIGSVAIPCLRFGTIENASISCSYHFQWYIAWSLTLARSAICTIHLARPVIGLMSTEALASAPSLHVLIGGAAAHYSDIFQWVIAWAFTLECVDGSFQFRQPCSLAGMRTLLDIIYVGINTLQIPWDPGACSSSTQRQGNPEGLNDACSNSPNAPSQVPWDHGDCSSPDRLGGKPNFKTGGLSAILPVSDASTQGLGWNLGQYCWASACSVVTRDSYYIYNRRWPRIGGSDRTDGFGLDLTRRSVFLCSSSSVSLVSTSESLNSMAVLGVVD